MTAHVLRPRYWAEQVIVLLPSLRPGDQLEAPEPSDRKAIELLLPQWQAPPGVKVVDADPQSATCLRCGSHVNGAFGIVSDHQCDCDLHIQTCPKIWSRQGKRDGLQYLVDRGIVPESALDPEAPCDCGGAELEHSIRHAADVL